MLRYLLDTNVCVRALRNRPPPMRERFNVEASSICISALVLTELLHEAAKSRKPEENRAAIDRFTERLEVLPFDAAAASHAGDIRAVLERRGQMIGVFDLLIAAHARSRGLIVVTSNMEEFARVEGLRCENWLSTPH